MKTFIFIAHLLVFTNFSHFSNGQSIIQGKIFDGSGEAIPFANVLLLHSLDSNLVKGMASSEFGIFSFDNVSTGSFMVSVSMVGYKTEYSSIIVIKNGDENIELLPFRLQEDLKLLDEITISANKQLYEQQGDRLVVNVQNSIMSAGSSVLEVLERSPGVTLDRQKNELNMNGKNGVVIMINGKPSRLPIAAVIQMMGGMNASNVEKIELISTPSANYDAEGNAGVINVILKENNEVGTNGSYSVNIGYGKFEKPGASFTINHRAKNLNLFADYSFLSDHLWQQFTNVRSVNYQGENTKTVSISDREAYRIAHNARIGLDYELVPNTSISTYVSGFSTRWDMDALNKINIVENDAMASLITIQNHEINHWKHFMGNFNICQSFNKSQVLTLDIDKLYYENQNPSYYINNYEDIMDGITFTEEMNLRKTTPIHLWVAKLDYVKDINSKTKLETGLKGTNSNLKNNILLENLREDEWIEDDQFSGRFKLNENIGAAYVNFHHQFVHDVKLQAGMRWEYTHTDLSDEEQNEIISRKYHSFFPGISVQKEIDKHSGFQASYSRRITRPSYTHLAPFVIFMDPFTYFSGNTALKPAITDAIQAGFRFMNSYMLTAQYSHDNNYIVPWQVRVDPETNLQFNFPDNINAVNTISLSLNFPLIMNSWWEMQNNLLAARQQISSVFEGKDINVQGQYILFTSSQTIKLPKDVSLELSGFFQSPRPTGFGLQKSTASVNLGAQKKFSGNRGNVSLTITDLFWTSRYTFNYKQPDIHQDQKFDFLAEPRVVKLTYTRNFGNKDVKIFNKRVTGSEEEQRRAPGS